MKKRKYLVLFLLPLLMLSFLSVGLCHTVPVSNTGLIGYWNFDETEGSTANDATVNNNDGTITAGTFVTGQWGNGLNFTGTANNKMETNVEVQTPNNFTATTWFKRVGSANSSYHTLISCINGANGYQTRLILASDGTSVLAQFSNATNTYSATKSGLAGDTNFHLYGMVWNGTHGGVIVDGVIEAWVSVEGSLVSGIYSLRIGTIDTNTFQSNGIQDELRIYNRLLSDSEILYLYEGEPDTPTPTPFVSATPFPEGAMDDTDWWISILVLLLIIINIFLMMLPFALVRFTFGILSLFLCMLALSYQIPLSPYLQTAGLLISALAMLFSVRARE